MENSEDILTEVTRSVYDAEDIPFEFLEEGVETALICVSEPSQRVQISNVLKEMGYRVYEALNTRDALKKTRFHTYDLVIIDEKFDSKDQDTNELHTYFSFLPMSTRRKMFVVLISDSFRTMDNMAAFNRSVNLIVNRKNIQDFAAILKKATADHHAFYHVFNDTLKKIGKF
ncbi:MAG: hypothetical protein N2317_01320 [Syntrophales bacterium]|nr:hypothetical protein [Syntrophales bacterium]